MTMAAEIRILRARKIQIQATLRSRSISGIRRAELRSALNRIQCRLRDLGLRDED